MVRRSTNPSGFAKGYGGHSRPLRLRPSAVAKGYGGRSRYNPFTLSLTKGQDERDLIDY